MAGMSIWQLLIIAAIVLLLFGTKKISNLGSDLGSAIKGFKKSMSEDEVDNKTESLPDSSEASKKTVVNDKDQV